MSALLSTLIVIARVRVDKNLAEQAAAELATLRADKLKLEIAARDFLRAVATRGHLLPSEYREAHDTLAAMVKKGDE